MVVPWTIAAVNAGQDGTAANPYTNTVFCNLPAGSRVNVLPFSHYTVQPSDFNLPGQLLTDTADLTWHDRCDDPAATGNTNCNPNPPTVGAGRPPSSCSSPRRRRPRSTTPRTRP